MPILLLILIVFLICPAIDRLQWSGEFPPSILDPKDDENDFPL